MSTYASIVTYNRPELLAQCVEAARGQVTEVLVIDNLSDPPAAHFGGNVTTVVDTTRPVNLSTLWNRGIRWAKERHESADPATLSGDPDQFEILLLCDDAIIPNQTWVEGVRGQLRGFGVTAASVDPWGRISEPMVKREPDSDFMTRSCAWALMVAGERGMVADERFQWWWGDVDLDWECRADLGTVLLPSDPYGAVVNASPNEYTTGERAVRAGVDGELFIDKWGWKPWG